MYHAHFGLERALFGEGIAADAAVYRSAKHDRLIAHFKLALASPSACVVLHGPAGVGKTTMTSAALRASSTRLALAWIGGMATNSAELLELILVELGITTLRTTRIERLQLWRQYLGELRATDSRLFVVAERTEDLSADVLHALDQLTAPDAAGNPGANLVLLGHASIHEHLAAPVLDSLRQRIRFRAELEPFTEAELQDYLRHQVACAGGHFDRLFAPGTVAALYRYSRGVARLANTLCESALDIAAVQQHKQLTAELVARTAVSLLGLTESAPARAVPAAPAAAQPETRAVSRATAPSPAAAAVASSPPAAAVAPSPAAAAVVVPAPHAAPPLVPTAGVAPAAAPTAAAPTPAAAVAPAAERLSEPVAANAAASVSAAAPRSASTPQTSAAGPSGAVSAAGVVPPAAATPKTAEVEYDGSVTDVADVALADFPVLTDAVEVPPPVAAPKPPPAAPLAAKAAAAAPSAAPAAFAKPPPPANRVETAYAAPRPAAKPAPPAPSAAPAAAPQPAPAARVAPPKPAAPPAPAAMDSEADDDVLRQTQTMRAIASAKSLDDISEVDAETLFGDAELDLVSAALASAAEWPDDDGYATPAPPSSASESAKPAARPEAAKGAPKPEPKPAAQADDPFDIFGLGDDAPLELMDDSTLPPASPARRTAVR